MLDLDAEFDTGGGSAVKTMHPFASAIWIHLGVRWKRCVTQKFNGASVVLKPALALALMLLHDMFPKKFEEYLVFFKIATSDIGVSASKAGDGFVMGASFALNVYIRTTRIGDGFGSIYFIFHEYILSHLLAIAYC